MLIAPGKVLKCIRSVDCDCGRYHATEGSLYRCETVMYGGFLHRRFLCDTDGCDGFLVFLQEKDHGLCACCFRPLDDGDTSLIEGERTMSYDEIKKLGDQERRRDWTSQPMKKPKRVLV